MNLSSFTGTIYIEKSSNLAKIWAEMKKPRWNIYVGHWNSYIGIPMSNIGIPTWVFQLQPRNSEAREPTNDSIINNCKKI